MHGGAAPQVAARREARILVGRARLAGLADEQRDPADALVAAAADADQLLQALKARISDEGGLTGEALMSLGDWLDRTSKLSKVVLDARVDERKVRLAEGQAKLLHGGLEWFLAQLPLDRAQQAAARPLLGKMLRSLSAGVVPSGRPVIEQ